MNACSGRGPLAKRNRALIVTLYATGVRISEALGLRPSDLDDGLTAVRVRSGKGGKARVAAFDASEADRAIVREWLSERVDLGLNGRQPLFCSVAAGRTRSAGASMDPAYVRRLLPRLAEAAGVDKRVHAHGLRHSHASSLVQRRVPLHVIAGQLGHASTSTTDAYLAKLDPSERIAAIRASRFDREPA